MSPTLTVKVIGGHRMCYFMVDNSLNCSGELCSLKYIVGGIVTSDLHLLDHSNAWLS